MKLRIVLLIFLVGLLPTLLGSFALLQAMKSNQVTYRIRQVQGQLLVLANELGKSVYLYGEEDEVLESELSQLADLYDGRILVIDSDFVVRKDTYALDEGRFAVMEDVLVAFSGTLAASYYEEANYFQITLPVYTEEGEIIGVLVGEVSTQTLQSLYQRLLQKFQTMMIIVVAFVVPIAFLLAFAILHPFEKIRKELDKAVSGSLEDVLMVRDYSETERISESYNNVIARLKRVDKSRQEFVSNVSHELKTPIASIKVLADSLLEQEEIPAELYREFLADIREEIEREGQIIEDLLALVRLDKSRQEMKVKSVNVNLFLENLMHRLKPLAQSKNLDMVLESFRPVTGELDEVKFSLAISNIIENAIKYSRQDGSIRVTLNADYQYFYIKVTDTGIGIPLEAQEHVFERFYRVDKSRSRENGGTGLGLSIAQDIVILHHGVIKLHSEEGEGTTFIVRVPLIYIP